MRLRYRLLSLCALAGCAGRSPGPEVPPLDLPRLEAERQRRPTDPDLLLRLGIARYQHRDYDPAADVLRAALAVTPSFAGRVYLGLSHEGAGRLDSAAANYRAAAALTRNAADRRLVNDRLLVVTQSMLTALAKQAVAQEAALSKLEPPPNTVAVLPWIYLGGSDSLKPLGRGITHLLITDLSKIPRLKLLEREQVQALAAEIGLADAGRVDPASGARAGRLIRAARVVQGSFREVPRSDDLRLDATVVVTTTAKAAGQSSASDRLAQLFAMEKQLVFKLLEQLGVTPTPAQRRAISERPTADLQAFLAFSRGLVEEDRGDFGAAAAAFEAASRRDPNFRAARDHLQSSTQLAAAVRTTPADLASSASQTMGPPPAATPAPSPSPSAPVGSNRSLTLQNAIQSIAPTTGSRLTVQTLSPIPYGKAVLPEALQQDNPAHVVIFGDIIIVIPRVPR